MLLAHRLSLLKGMAAVKRLDKTKLGRLVPSLFVENHRLTTFYKTDNGGQSTPIRFIDKDLEKRWYPVISTYDLFTFQCIRVEIKI